MYNFAAAKQLSIWTDYIKCHFILQSGRKVVKMANNKKKIAVITGSAGGLGKEFAKKLLQSGKNAFVDIVGE